jgi:hypothetical protein
VRKACDADGKGGTTRPQMTALCRVSRALAGTLQSLTVRKDIRGDVGRSSGFATRGQCVEDASSRQRAAATTLATHCTFSSGVTRPPFQSLLLRTNVEVSLHVCPATCWWSWLVRTRCSWHLGTESSSEADAGHGGSTQPRTRTKHPAAAIRE